LPAGSASRPCARKNETGKTAFSRQLSAVSFQPSAFSRQLSAVSFQPSAFSRQLSAVSFQPSAFSRQLSAVSHQPVGSVFVLHFIHKLKTEN
jgi:hypothetical protein